MLVVRNHPASSLLLFDRLSLLISSFEENLGILKGLTADGAAIPSVTLNLPCEREELIAGVTVEWFYFFKHKVSYIKRVSHPNWVLVAAGCTAADRTFVVVAAGTAVVAAGTAAAVQEPFAEGLLSPQTQTNSACRYIHLF